MAYIKMLWAVFLGTVVGIILGIIFDWAMQNGYVLEKGAEYTSLYPWVAGGGALFGAVMAVVVLGPNLIRATSSSSQTASRRQAIAQPRGAKPVAKAVKAKPAAKGKKPNPKDKDFVEGMPSFDFSAASKDIPSEPMPKNKGKK